MSQRKIRNEIDFVRAIARKPRSKDVVLGIGDDAAVVRVSPQKYMLLTADMFVEEDHFSLRFSEPHEIGIKAIEANVSDIAAMGGIPKYALLSVALRRNTPFSFVKGLYRGIHSSCRRHGVDLIGGDTTHGKEINISVSMIGTAKPEELTPRSGAKEGDYIMVSGPLGTSSCGLELLRKGKAGFASVKNFHKAPRAQLAKSRKICRHAGAMEDISDGLASEVRNICAESMKGAVIYRDRIPVRTDVRKASALLGKDASDFALYGGEDFELVFTVSRRSYRKAKALGTVVGEITKGRKVLLTNSKGKTEEIKSFGYDHFARVKV
jgi:thiamine-monophosphate kinase